MPDPQRRRAPPGIDLRVENGTLLVRLPKAAAAKARRIVVRSGGGD